MSDTIDAAPAAAEPSNAPVDQAPVQTPNPVEAELPVKEPEAKPEPKADEKGQDKEPAPKRSVSDALKKAEADLREKATKPETDKPEAKDKAKPVETEARQRDDTGKFAAKEPVEGQDKPKEATETAKAADTPDKQSAPFRDPPKRFSEDAKAAWETAPDPVKAEVHRAMRELEGGIEKYRAEYEPIKPYADLAKQHGTSVKDALDRYTGLEKMLGSQDQNEKFAGLQQVFDYAGINPREFAAQLMGQTPEQGAVQQDNTIRELRQELAAIKQQLGGVSTSMQERQQQEVLSSVQQFAADKPRFDELAEDIVFFLTSGRTQDLQEAYQLAERLNPAPAPQPALAQTQPEPTPEAHTLKGSKSVSGAPSNGASRPNAQPSSSIKEALKRAAAQAS